MLCSAVYRTTPDCSRVFYTPYLAFIAAPCLSLIWLQTNKPQEKLYNTVAQHSTAGKELVCTGNLLHWERKREDDRYYRSCQEKQHFLKGNKYQEDCNQTFMEDKTDAQTRKHMIFLTEAFVSYLQHYVKCKYSQIFGWSIHWQKVLCSYLLVELHRLKLESSQLAFDFEQLKVQLLIGGPRTNLPTTTCRWCTNIENLISKFLVELHFANLELGGLIISSKSDEWLDIVQQVPQRIIYSWKRWKRAKSRQFLEMGIFIAYQWDPIHSIPWSWNNNLFQFSFFCRSQPASCSPL